MLWWPFVGQITRELQKFYKAFVYGLRPKLVISTPPQHGKSWAVEDFIAWVAGKHPQWKTIYASFSDELGTLRRALPAALGVLAVGGRVVVLAYHSLEDRIVKRELVRLSADQTPPGLPVPASAAAPQFRLLTRGAERPDSEEVAGNPRAASARLRAAERIREAA